MSVEEHYYPKQVVCHDFSGGIAHVLSSFLSLSSQTPVWCVRVNEIFKDNQEQCHLNNLMSSVGFFNGSRTQQVASAAVLARV